MPRGVLDTGILVSAMLNPTPGGASFDILHFAREGRFELHLSPGIIEETAHVLLTRKGASATAITIPMLTWPSSAATGRGTLFLRVSGKTPQCQTALRSRRGACHGR
jgi:PIN domain